MSSSKSENITWHNNAVTPADMERLHGHKGVTLWFTGLSGSGKSTLANAAALKLHSLGVSTFILDGDNIRYGLNSDLGFSPGERKENIRRIGEVAKLFTACAVVNLTAFISPYKKDREIARQLQPETFIEVYCCADIQICRERDPKGLYKKAVKGEIKNFTGVDAPYEPPETPEILVDTGKNSIDECSDIVVEYLRTAKIIP
jgi:adenylylsulfate kinase